MHGVFICDGIRTPIDRYGSALVGVRTDNLMAILLRELLNHNLGLDPTATNDVTFGCVNQTGKDNRNVAYMVTLLAGYSHSVPGTTISRLCKSGLDVIDFAARTTKAGDVDLLIAGDVGSMPYMPFMMGKMSTLYQRWLELFGTTIG